MLTPIFSSVLLAAAELLSVDSSTLGKVYNRSTNPSYLHCMRQRVLQMSAGAPALMLSGQIKGANYGLSWEVIQQIVRSYTSLARGAVRPVRTRSK
jgi:hypothetical protein